MTKTKPKQHKPVVSGRPTTYAALAKVLGMTPAGAAAKYRRIKRDHGSVTMVQMRSPYVTKRSVQVAANKLLREQEAALVAHARQHGSIHTAMVHNVDAAYVQQLLDAATKRVLPVFKRTVRYD